MPASDVGARETSRLTKWKHSGWWHQSCRWLVALLLPLFTWQVKPCDFFFFKKNKKTSYFVPKPQNYSPETRPKVTKKETKQKNQKKKTTVAGFFFPSQKKRVNHKTIWDPNETTTADTEKSFFFFFPSMYHEYREEISPFPFPKLAAKLVILTSPAVYFRLQDWKFVGNWK